MTNELKFFEVAIDEDVGNRAEYVGMIHSAYPITYTNRQTTYENLFGPNKPYSNLVKVI